MFPSARLLGAATLMVVAAACSPDPARFLAEKAAAAPAPKRLPVSRAAAERTATAAKAAAVAEAALNPLVRIFGSQAQRDAEAAQARLNEVIARGGKRRTRPAKVADTAKSTTAAAKVIAHKAARAPVAPRTAKTVEGKPGSRAATAKATSIETSSKVPAVSLERRTARNAEPPKAVATPTPTRAALVVIVYDVAAGIKTLHRADGTVEEEAFDPATLPAVKAGELGRTQIRIVNEANPVSTGSTGIAQPQSPAAIKAGPR